MCQVLTRLFIEKIDADAALRAPAVLAAPNLHFAPVSRPLP
jgi:hypothetical protein